MAGENKIIDKALTLFTIDDEGVQWKGKLFSLYVDLIYKANIDKRLCKLAIFARYIVQDIWNIVTIIHRMKWIQAASANDEFLEGMWLPYASVDIEHFHIEIRSIMDYAATIIAISSNKCGQVPDSFRKLFDWISKSPNNRKRIGEELAKVVETATWFADFRGVRDTLIHSGAFTIVFGSPKDGILFQVYRDNLKNMIFNDCLMFNPNVVYFERYAAIYLSHVFIFLEMLCEVIYQKFDLKSIGKPVKFNSPGYNIILGWIKNLKELLQKTHSQSI